MSSRNISRTAIEGGRVGACRYSEHRTTRKERAQERIRLRRVIFDRDYADEVFIEHRVSFITWIGRDFADKLNPVKRWLASRVGRPWDAVYSEIRKTFDFRSTPGRHIVGHIDFFVTMWSDLENRRGEYPPYPGELYVGEDGILRQAPFETRRGWYGRHAKDLTK